MNPTISVVIAAYNAESFLAETIKSVQAQTFRDFEIIVVDDGSTDDTPAIVSAYPDIRYLRQTNRGQPAARNVGITAASGEYVAFVDADDLWFPKKLQKQMDYFAAHPGAAWVYSDANLFDSVTGAIICRIGSKLRMHRGDILRSLILDNFVPSATPMVRRSALIAAGLFQESRERDIGEDWNMWLRLAERHPAGFVDEPLAAIRSHADNMTSTTHPLWAHRSKWAIVEDAVERNPLALGSLRSNALSRISSATALGLLHRGDASAACNYVLQALRLDPWNWTAYGYLAVTLLPNLWLPGLWKLAASLRRAHRAHQERTAAIR